MRRYKTRRKLKSYQTYGLRDIANIFCQSLGVTSHAKMFLMVCHNGFGIRSKEIVIHSNGLGYLFSKSCHRFEKKVIRLNGLGYPFNRLNDWSYLFKDKFQPSFHPKTISSLATHVKQSVILQVMYIMKFVLQMHHLWIVMDLCSFVAICTFILSIEYWHTFYSILKFFFFNTFPENNIFYLLHFCSLWASGTELHFPCMSRT